VTQSSAKVTRRAALSSIATAALGAGTLLTGRAASAETNAQMFNNRGGWEDQPPNPADLPPNVPPWMQEQGRP